jgi:hypothetical protein
VLARAADGVRDPPLVYGATDEDARVVHRLDRDACTTDVADAPAIVQERALRPVLLVAVRARDAPSAVDDPRHALRSARRPDPHDDAVLPERRLPRAAHVDPANDRAARVDIARSVEPVQLPRDAVDRAQPMENVRERKLRAIRESHAREFAPTVAGERARLIMMNPEKWVNGTVLRYAFFDDSSPWGSAALKDQTRKAFQRWLNLGIGLKIEEVPIMPTRPSRCRPASRLYRLPSIIAEARGNARRRRRYLSYDVATLRTRVIAVDRKNTALQHRVRFTYCTTTTHAVTP